LHLVGIYMTIITKMHGTMNIKFYDSICLVEGFGLHSTQG